MTDTPLEVKLIQKDAPVAVQDGFSAAIADAERAAIEVFRDSCDHTRQAIEYMAAYLLAAVSTPPATQRKFSGPGHLEETGYIPAGSAAEREGK